VKLGVLENAALDDRVRKFEHTTAQVILAEYDFSCCIWALLKPNRHVLSLSEATVQTLLYVLRLSDYDVL